MQKYVLISVLLVTEICIYGMNARFENEIEMRKALERRQIEERHGMNASLENEIAVYKTLERRQTEEWQKQDQYARKMQKLNPTLPCCETYAEFSLRLKECLKK